MFNPVQADVKTAGEFKNKNTIILRRSGEDKAWTRQGQGEGLVFIYVLSL